MFVTPASVHNSSISFSPCEIPNIRDLKYQFSRYGYIHTKNVTPVKLFLAYGCRQAAFLKPRRVRFFHPRLNLLRME